MAKFYWFLGHEQFQPEVLVKHAQLAEKAGFDGVMVSEHFHPWVADIGAGGFAFATLGAIAAATSRIELLTAVTTPLFRYHPAVVAQAAATLDRLSAGRFMLGVGTGENINEAPLGLPFPRYHERAERLHEALDILSGLLAGHKLNYEGSYYQTHAAKLYSPPLHPVKILMAAGGPKSAAMAGAHAAGVIVSVKSNTDALSKVIEPARAAAPEGLIIAATRWSVWATDDNEAWQALQPWRGLRAPNRLSATDPLVLQNEADAIPRAEIMNSYAQIRDFSEFIGTYAPLITELGADIVGIQATSLNQPQLITDFGKHILPQLRQLKPPKA